MKLHLLAAVSAVSVALATAMITGCGSGMTSRAQLGTPNEKMLQAVDAELANAIVGTTTLTSAPLPPMPLPESRMPVSRNAGAKEARPPMQTWGATPEPDPELSEYGF